MDKLDIAIIQALQEDARKPYTDIAKTLNVAESTVRNRVARLLDDDTLRLRATFDYMKLGFNASAFLNVVVRPGKLEEVAHKLKAIPEVSYLLAITGTPDLLAELTCRDHQHLMEVITQRVHAIDGIVSTSTSIIMKVYKELLPTINQECDWRLEIGD